jgi:hypothetical protein
MRHSGFKFLVASICWAQAHGHQYQPRDNSSDEAALPATVSNVSAGFVSGQEAVTTQLKADAHAAIDDFSNAITSASGNSTTQSSAETAQLFTTIVKGGEDIPVQTNYFFLNDDMNIV